MESRSHHSRLANQVNQPSLAQKSFNHHTQFSGIKQNGFQKMQSPSTSVVNSVNINTRLK